jgi:hypothetical protein
MKKLGFIALLFVAFFVSSCGGAGGGDNANIDKNQIVGKWMTVDEQYFEVYYSNGTGKEWDLRDDVQEEEASEFTWEFDEETEDKFLKYYKMEINDAIVPQYCNILELTSTDFKYNNEGFRATYNLIRAE